MTANANDFRTEIGVFLGQVTLEECDFDRASQKWAVILWSEQDDGKTLYIAYIVILGGNLTLLINGNSREKAVLVLSHGERTE